MFDPSRKILLLLQLLFFLLSLLFYLLLKRLFYLLLFLYVVFFLLGPYLLVKHFLVSNDFAPFVRRDLAWNIRWLFPPLNVKFAGVSSFRSFQSISRTSEPAVRKTSYRWLLLQLCDRLQVYHTLPDIEVLLEALLTWVSIYILSFY